MKIIVFGGAFNPPHNLHFLLAEQVLNQISNVEKIIFMPVSTNYKKREKLISNSHRYNMLKLMCETNPKFEISKIELEATKQLYTLETLLKLKKEYPKQEIIFCTGTDNLKEIEKWYKSKELLEKFKILVLERQEDNMENIIMQNSFLSKNKTAFIKLKNSIRSNLSSTIVKEKLKNDENVEHILPKPIYNYIKENRLYEGDLKC